MICNLKESLKSNGLAISLGLVALNAIFISLSAITFMEMENRNIEDTTKAKAQRFQDLKGWMKQRDSYILDEGEWNKLKSLHKPRCFKDNNDFAVGERFNFWTSFDFCSTIISTIGYGSLYPDRDLGKIVGIFYALFGIPLMLCFLNVCCDALSSCVSVLIKRISARRLGLQTIRIIKVCIIFTVLCIYILTMSTILHMYSKDDSMIDSLYFYVITLTTTGIGDISMVDHNALILVRVFAVFLLGLTLVTTLINSIRDAAKEYMKQGLELKSIKQGHLYHMMRNERARQKNGKLWVV
ncbi:hypothetical protein ACHWQZ_G012571 [Mnemiopsis leidyi]